MKRVPVRSSNLISVGYDSALRVLEAEFKHGSVYQYFGVPSMVYEGLRATSDAGASVGRYFDQHVKKAGYPYTEV